MSTLVCHVRSLLPFSVVTMAGTLDDDSMIKAGMVLRDCLAAQPTVVIIEAVHLAVVGDRPLEWLRTIGADAARWPGAPVLICAGPAALDATGSPRPATLSAAMNTAQHLPVVAQARFELPPAVSSCARARSHVAGACRSWGLSGLSRLAQLLASELVANVVVHARTPMLLTLRRLERGLEVSVRDGDPRQVRAGDADTRGAGLELVAALATAWGCAPTASGKVVWARVEDETTRHGSRDLDTRVGTSLPA